MWNNLHKKASYSFLLLYNIKNERVDKKTVRIILIVSKKKEF